MYISCVAGREKERERARELVVPRFFIPCVQCPFVLLPPHVSDKLLLVPENQQAERGQSYNASKISMPAYGATSLTQRDLAIWDRFN